MCATDLLLPFLVLKNCKQKSRDSKMCCVRELPEIGYPCLNVVLHQEVVVFCFLAVLLAILRIRTVPPREI